MPVLLEPWARNVRPQKEQAYHVPKTDINPSSTATCLANKGTHCSLRGPTASSKSKVVGRLHFNRMGTVFLFKLPCLRGLQYAGMQNIRPSPAKVLDIQPPREETPKAFSESR